MMFISTPNESLGQIIQDPGMGGDHAALPAEVNALHNVIFHLRTIEASRKITIGRWHLILRL